MTLVTVAIMADYETFSPWDFSPSVTLRASTQHEVGSKWLKFQSWLDYPCKATLTVIILTLSSVLSRTRGKKIKSWGGREGWEATATNISRSQSILGISSRCQKPTPIRSLHSSRRINSRWDSLIDNYSYLQTSPVTGKQINGRGGGGSGERRSAVWQAEVSGRTSTFHPAHTERWRCHRVTVSDPWVRSERDDKGNWRRENWQIITKARGPHFVSPPLPLSLPCGGRAHSRARKQASTHSLAKNTQTIPSQERQCHVHRWPQKTERKKEKKNIPNLCSSPLYGLVSALFSGDPPQEMAAPNARERADMNARHTLPRALTNCFRIHFWFSYRRNGRLGDRCRHIFSKLFQDMADL